MQAVGLVPIGSHGPASGGVRCRGWLMVAAGYNAAAHRRGSAARWVLEELDLGGTHHVPTRPASALGPLLVFP